MRLLCSVSISWKSEPRHELRAANFALNLQIVCEKENVINVEPTGSSGFDATATTHRVAGHVFKRRGAAEAALAVPLQVRHGAHVRQLAVEQALLQRHQLVGRGHGGGGGAGRRRCGGQRGVQRVQRHTLLGLRRVLRIVPTDPGTSPRLPPYRRQPQPETLVTI